MTKVVGIDPAPGKKSHVVEDGSLLEPMTADRLASFLERLRNEYERILVCWDAPLSGPARPDARPADEAQVAAGDHTQRPIEKFFSRQVGCKAPTGISVLHYGGCPHWTISQRLLGLPRTGPWMAPWDDLPFCLLEENSMPDGNGHYITEVHPAVALWLWGIEADEPPSDWRYKKDSTVLTRLWEMLEQRLLAMGLLDADHGFEPADDDELDAFVAWALGTLWAEGWAEVTPLGNRATGSFLLPISQEHNLYQRFLNFVNTLPDGSLYEKYAREHLP